MASSKAFRISISRELSADSISDTGTRIDFGRVPSNFSQRFNRSDSLPFFTVFRIGEILKSAVSISSSALGSSFRYPIFDKERPRKSTVLIAVGFTR